MINLTRFENSTQYYGGTGANVKTTTNTATLVGGVSTEVKTFYDTQLLENARANFAFAQFGKKQPLAKGNGKSVEFRKFNTFDRPAQALTEGIIPPASSFTVVPVNVPTAQYGAFVAVSDVLEYTAIDPLIAEITNENGNQAGDTIDAYIRNAILPDVTTVHNATGTGTKVTSADIAWCASTLKNSNTPKIDGNYVAIIHPSVSHDLRQDEGWVDANEYAGSKNIFNGEIGELHGVRFVESTNAPIKKDTSDNRFYYHTLIFGMDAYGVVEPNGMSLETIIKSADQAGGPLNQFSTVGWKAMLGAKVLYADRIVDLKSLSTFTATAEN